MGTFPSGQFVLLLEFVRQRISSFSLFSLSPPHSSLSFSLSLSLFLSLFLFLSSLLLPLSPFSSRSALLHLHEVRCMATVIHRLSGGGFFGKQRSNFCDSNGKFSGNFEESHPSESEQLSLQIPPLHSDSRRGSISNVGTNPRERFSKQRVLKH